MKPKEIFKNYPIALFAGAGIIVFSSLAFLRSSVASDLKDNLVTREAEASRLSENVHNAQKLDVQLEQMGSLNKKISERLSNPSDLASNQQYFYKLESDTKVKLLDLHQATKGSKKKSGLTFYSTILYNVKVQGDYAHLLGFLRSLESGSKLSAIVAAQMDLPGGTKVEDLSPSTPMFLTLDVELLGTI